MTGLVRGVESRGVIQEVPVQSHPRCLISHHPIRKAGSWNLTLDRPDGTAMLVSVERPNELSGSGHMADADGTRRSILGAARECIIRHGVAALSTRMIAEAAKVPVSQLHYHFGGKQGVMLALLDQENERLLARQTAMFAEDLPLWKRWEQACDFLEDDLRTGYVAVLQQMVSAGWTDPEVAERVRERLLGWFRLLADVARAAATELGGLGPFTPEEVAALVGDAFLGAEARILLGMSEEEVPSRSALRRVGTMIRRAEETAAEVDR